MTPSELKEQILLANPESHFFDRRTMKFFGDSMHNFGVRSAGDNWELYRKRPVAHRLQSSHFFSKTTFRTVYP